jgi:group II intron reverse transcriptase/maturase
MDVLEEAYRKVKANGGASGIDGQRCEDVEQMGLAIYLEELQVEMKEGRYRPQPVKRVYIPKVNGKKRPLGIPTVRDRIVQTAFVLILEPIFEADFSDASYGFRPKRSAHDAVREIAKYLNWGCVEVYDVDIEKYFDTVEHWKLIRLVARRISDGQVLRVIRQWLRCGYVEDGQHRQSRCGTPQGGVISPLLANVYLSPVDQAFECSGLGVLEKGSVHLVRYADDMLVLARKNLDEGIDLVKHYIGRLGLKLNEEKTRRIKMAHGQSVDFLGFRFLYTRNRKTGNRLILVHPSPASQQRFREEVRKRVHHSRPVRLKDQVVQVNAFLRGWVGYFRLGNGSAVFRDLAWFVEKRVRRVYQRRRGRSGYGWYRISREYLYQELGLFADYRVCWL